MTHIQHQKCEKVIKWVGVIKIEAVIAVCIVETTYTENAQKKFNMYVKYVVGRYSYVAFILL